ncbi:hypothetical protein J2Z48_001567 [Croceifilum oryzae]|uniref:Uncharacterized protein n=1 Tax=Croceifilum oryzae TaxID=1553429 RepID=A0AAJ1TJW4_9BACL|nr:hypothetical protein [Croceifilum oryzae]
MLKLKVEGLSQQVQSFLYDLEQRPHVELQQQENGYQIKDGKVTSCTKCEVNIVYKIEFKSSKWLHLMEIRSKFPC